MVICFRFILQSTLTRHIKRVHDLAFSKVCDVCAQFFITEKSYNIHYLSNHTNIDQKVQCDECGKWLKHMDMLKEHKRRHRAPAAKCQFCDKIFSNKKALRSHVAGVHVAASHECTVCHKMFKTKTTLKVRLFFFLKSVWLYCSIYLFFSRNTLQFTKAVRISINVHFVLKHFVPVQICIHTDEKHIQWNIKVQRHKHLM